MDLLTSIALGLMAITPYPIETVGDSASGHPTFAEKVEVLPTAKDPIHAYTVQIIDSKGFSELRGDSFHARIRLEEAPVGLELCVHMRPSMSEMRCDKTYYELPGIYGHNDSQDVRIWIRWAEGAPQQAGTYRLTVSGV